MWIKELASLPVQALALSTSIPHPPTLQGTKYSRDARAQLFQAAQANLSLVNTYMDFQYPRLAGSGGSANLPQSSLPRIIPAS